MPRTRSLACYLAAILGVVSGTFAPAHADTITVACRLTPAEQEKWARLGYGPNTVVMHITIDTEAKTATDYSTSPSDTTAPRPTVYPATVTSDLVTWSTPPDEDDGSKATRYFNRTTNVLNTVDPFGSSTLWNCN